ncbi:MAG TPA: PPOX class F420-dependent oxidoreductase [Gaiellaceae bacterium]|nr:PPOX class F420-dependent oxidoreductase [Gaiellaceae bacterium]
MAKLTDNQAALLRGKNWGTVVTLREDGSPHATPVWIDSDGDHVLFNTSIGRAKERHLRRDPRVAVTVLPAENQQGGYLSVTGHAELTEEGAKEHIDSLANKYLGVDEYPYLQPGERRVIVKITPEKIDAQGID